MKTQILQHSTVQNWYPGDENGVGGVYNFVTKRGLCKGDNSKISDRLKLVHYLEISSCILRGDNSVGEFYSARNQRQTTSRYWNKNVPCRKEHKEY